MVCPIGPFDFKCTVTFTELSINELKTPRKRHVELSRFAAKTVTNHSGLRREGIDLLVCIERRFHVHV